MSRSEDNGSGAIETMTKHVKKINLVKLSEFVGERLGLYFPKERQRDLLKGISSAAKVFGYQDVEACIQWLLTSDINQSQIETLACNLTVGETYFLREKRTLDVIEKRIFPSLIRARERTDRRIRIWSAGCCTGEEPFTLAILLDQMIPDIQNWNISILATDINPTFLVKATRGIYREWSFRGTPQWLRDRFFIKHSDEEWEILPHLKKMVRFTYLNLVEDVYPTVFNDTNAMDLVFCRNVMMYFHPMQMQRTVDRFHRTLVEDGWLIVGASESSNVYFSQFKSQYYPGAICYQKKQHRDKEESISRMMWADAVDTISQSSTSQPIAPSLPEKGIEKDIPCDPDDVQSDQSEIISDDDLLNQAEILYQKGFYTETEEIVKKILAKNTKDVRAMTLMAKVLANKGMLSDALVWCRKAITVDKLNPQFHHLCASILEEQGAVDEAVQALRHALYLDSDFVLAHFMMGNLLRHKGRLGDAEKCYHNALSLLDSYDHEEVLPESDGIVAGRLAEIIRLTKYEDRPA